METLNKKGVTITVLGFEFWLVVCVVLLLIVSCLQLLFISGYSVLYLIQVLESCITNIDTF